MWAILTRVKLANLSRILPVQEKMRNLSFQPSPPFKGNENIQAGLPLSVI